MFRVFDAPVQIGLRIGYCRTTGSQTDQPLNRTIVGCTGGVGFPAGPGFWKTHHDSHHPREI
jgi:hypothetical protein